jgi:DNA-binding transcriptional MocR family regulator
MSDEWIPNLSGRKGPAYRAIVNAIAEDIAERKLRPGARMPTHRHLAERLGLNLGTITRAYTVAKSEGLLFGETGRGTFVSAARREPAADSPIDLALNKPVAAPSAGALSRTLHRIANNYALDRFTEYPRSIGSQHHRAAGTKLAARTGIEATPDAVVITNGAQQALMASLAALVNPGDTVATEALNYAGIRRLADFLRVRLHPIAMDAHGAVPDSFEEACRRGKVSALVLTPTIQNPTATTLNADRRAAFARIAVKYGAPIVENDIYGPLPLKPATPITTLAKNNGCYICGTSKSISPGLRVGYVIAPPRLVDSITNAVHATTWAVASLVAEIIDIWLEDGTADQLIKANREEIARRQAIAREYLSDFTYSTHPQSYHLWLTLPAQWRLHEFIEACAGNGVSITPSLVFSINSTYSPNAIRVSLGAEDNIERMKMGLDRLARTLRMRPLAGASIV